RLGHLASQEARSRADVEDVLARLQAEGGTDDAALLDDVGRAVGGLDPPRGRFFELLGCAHRALPIVMVTPSAQATAARVPPWLRRRGRPPARGAGRRCGRTDDPTPRAPAAACSSRSSRGRRSPP